MKKHQVLTISKGYRLRPETHKLIKNLQKKVGGSQDKIISQAIKQYQNKIHIK